MRIAIIGGGIVGLTTALSLARLGFKPVVYEAVGSPAPLGVGINLLPHAVRELTELGLLEKVEELGVPIQELVYRMSDGREVWREPRGLSAGYDWPQIAVHRGRFQMLLLSEVTSALGTQAVRFGHSLRALQSSASGVSLMFADRATGERVASTEADLVIGADGIHSVLRRKFYPSEGVPRWNGISLFRGTTTLPPGSIGAAMIWAGRSDQKFAGYPISVDKNSGGILFNWICDLRTAEPGTVPREDWNRKVDTSVLLPRYARWRWPDVDVPEVVETAGHAFEFPMVDRDPLPRWTFGHITLAGDAAHPMYPIGSNGATQGIIDARCLAFHVATAPTLDEALARYEDERRETTSRIVLNNRQHGPDRVLEIAAQRAADATADLDREFPMSERAAIAKGYKALAGFDPASLRARRSYTPTRSP